MISYRISLAELEDLIDAEVPSWRKRATIRTQKFLHAGGYNETSSIWSEVKAVYMRLQGEGKCIYCERKLEGEQVGKAEHDVEHFRPKNRVRPWKVSAALKRQGLVMTAPAKTAPGYPLLAYHLFNYSTACKPCNSALKSDRFPICGTYDYAGSDPAIMSAEKPLLIYPVGDFDTDAQQLITFYGVSPQPVAVSGEPRVRALATIAFFELDNAIKRKNLLRERAMIICILFPQLEKVAAGNTSRSASTLIASCLSHKSPHANCARSFERLFKTSPLEAEQLFESAAAFIESSS